MIVKRKKRQPQKPGMSPQQCVALRVALNLTQSEFGTLVQVSKEQVSRWETGRSIITQLRADSIRKRVAPILSGTAAPA